MTAAHSWRAPHNQQPATTLAAAGAGGVGSGGEVSYAALPHTAAQLVAQRQAAQTLLQRGQLAAREASQLEQLHANDSRVRTQEQPPLPPLP